MNICFEHHNAPPAPRLQNTAGMAAAGSRLLPRRCATIGAMSLSSLYLAPEDPQSAPDVDGVTDVLRELGLIDQTARPGDLFGWYWIQQACDLRRLPPF